MIKRRRSERAPMAFWLRLRALTGIVLASTLLAACGTAAMKP
ncbi:MAG: hypothetical protein M0Z66_04910 [Thermaerobacter sp.]|nr:hypothetical protein [Thermaerobacter sp.]